MGSPHSMFVPSRPEQIRLCTPQEAAALVRSGDKIAISANANTPRLWLEALFARAEQLEEVEIMHMRLVGAFPKATPDLARHIRFNPLLVPEAGVMQTPHIQAILLCYNRSDFCSLCLPPSGRSHATSPRRV